MLDIKLVREKPEIVKEDLKKRRESEKISWVDELLDYDRKWRELTQKINGLRHRRNVITKEIAQLKIKGQSIKTKMKEVEEIPDRIKKLEVQASKYKDKVNLVLMKLPNILHDSVP